MPSHPDVPIRLFATDAEEQASEAHASDITIMDYTVVDNSPPARPPSPIATDAQEQASEAHASNITIMDYIVDNSPPARPPSPSLTQFVSPVNLTTHYHPAPMGFMGIGIKCWSCDVYNSITVPLNRAEVRLLISFSLFY